MVKLNNNNNRKNTRVFLNTPVRRRVVNTAKNVGLRLRKIRSIKTKDFASSVFNDVQSCLTSNVANPTALTILVAVSVFVVSYRSSFDQTKFGTWVNNSNNEFCKLIKENKDKFFALLLFVPTVFTVPTKYTTIVMLLVFVWVSLVPQATFIEYSFQSFALFLYFSSRKTETKFAIIIASLIAYMLGWVTLPIANVPMQPTINKKPTILTAGSG
nr:MAG: hypothetical protein [Drosophila Hillwood park negevirus]